MPYSVFPVGWTLDYQEYVILLSKLEDIYRFVVPLYNLFSALLVVAIDLALYR